MGSSRETIRKKIKKNGKENTAQVYGIVYNIVGMDYILGYLRTLISLYRENDYAYSSSK
jgi:uncharacterized membrane protein affecting hemolysin expression